MYKNQLQELAQRSCFNLPAYSCIREGPDHAPRFKATVNFNGETFESPTFCSTLRQAEHAAAEVALNTLAKRGPSRALAARVLDETGVYKNLLQETAHRAGLNLPVYTTVRSGPGHVPVFSCAVEIAGMKFTGDPARTKKQAQKNAAMAAWSALRKLSQHRLSSATSCSFPSDSKANEEQEQVTIARVLASLQPPESKYLSESDNQHKWHESTMSSVRTSLPMPPMCQSCGFSGFSPDMAMYQIWQHEQILQPQNHLLALAIPSTIPSAPQIYPFVQSMLQPDPCLYFPARDLASVPVGANFSIAPTNTSFYLPNQILPHLCRARSTVTIREIQEEKAENTSEFSLPAIPDSLVCNSRNETRIPKPSEDDRQKTGGSESKTNVLLGADQTVKSEWTSHGNIGSAYKQVNFQSQNPPSINNSRPIFRAQEKANAHRSFRPPPAASSSSMIRTTGPSSSSGSRMQHWQVPLAVPPIMRAGGPRNSAMPRSERFDMAGAPPLFMAPAVRIRSVVPVCSAPPRRSTQEEGSVNKEKKEPKTEGVSRTCSELGNLRI